MFSVVWHWPSNSKAARYGYKRQSSRLHGQSLLNGIIENLGAKSTAKGNALEPLVRQILRRFSDFQLMDLPFLKGIKLPTWCKGRRLQIDEINTADGFGYKHGKTEADLRFLIDHPRISCWVRNLENETSSDIRYSFLQADGTKENSSLKRIRDDFIASGVPDRIKGILHIHVEILRVQGMRPATYVRIDPSTGTEDVMVYIGLSNMDGFFYEGIGENKRDVPYVKKLIRYVLAK
ncbi:MAG: hypothetical protein J3R72DRAFT_493791 [Linnemannia gamsii]|nr:MAG: hypothetical protein J3R72DRAFT_493791 [Linnemannia gamsii]